MSGAIGEGVGEMLPLEVLLDEAGHLSDVGVTVLGDGQTALVPPSVLVHVDSCAACCQRMGEAALLSEEIGEAVRAAAPHEATSRATATPERASVRPARRFPVAMVAAALFAACLGLAPSLYGSPAWLASTASALQRILPVMAKSGYLLLKSGGGRGPVMLLLPLLSATVLMMFGLAVAKRLPRVAMVQRGA